MCLWFILNKKYFYIYLDKCVMKYWDEVCLKFNVCGYNVGM